MVVQIGTDLERVLTDHARRTGVAPEELALNAPREQFMPNKDIVPQDEWERSLLGAAVDCGVSLSNEAVSSEGIYE